MHFIQNFRFVSEPGQAKFMKKVESRYDYTLLDCIIFHIYERFKESKDTQFKYN